ncbi:MAG: hypothetical protein KDI51_02435 [Xanthomonadales bacterium]|nr:hypothetical protein [Xanthomonadales bacterium]
MATPITTAIDAALADAPERERVAAMVEAVLTEPLYWFPLRHHSPTAAHLLRRVIEQRKPKLLLLEAPAGVEPLLPHVVDRQTRPPVAIYSSFRDDQFQLRAQTDGEEPLQLASWYPLLPYSPEYVAIRSALASGAQVVCIDLPQAGQQAARLARTGADPLAVDRSQSPDNANSLAPEDALLAGSELYRRLAEAAGYRHWDEAWDSLFEAQPLPDAERFRRELTTFCAAARLTTPSEQEDPDNAAREAFMWQRIQAALVEHQVAPEQAMVVCGGYHLFMPREPLPPMAAQPAGTVHQAIVPYSYLRAWQSAGYGAGNRAPRYYQRLHEAQGRGEPEQALIEESVGILQQARRKGERLASADAIAVQHHAVLLAQLRGRALPTLDDLDDALLSCCVKGDPTTDGAQLQRIMRRVHVGDRIGKVTPAAGQLPLVRDYYAQIEALELSELLQREQVQWLKLDLRQPQDAARASFFERLRQLGVKLAERQDERNPFGHSLFQQRWRWLWSADGEAALIERSLDGDSVVAAAQTGFLRELGDAGLDAGGCCRLLLRAVAMDLPELMRHAREACLLAIDNDSRFLSLADALTSLRVLERSIGAQWLGQAALNELLERCWDRACFAVPEVANAPAEEHPAVIQALKSLAEVALSSDQLDGSLFASYARNAADLSTVAELRGAFLAVLVDIRALPVTALADELAAYAGSTSERQLQVGDFLHGVLAVSTTAVMLGARSLVAALDEVISVVGREVFLAMLPRLRAAIEQLAPRLRDALAGAVAVHLGVARDRLDSELPLGAAAHALIAELDAETARIMADWSLS